MRALMIAVVIVATLVPPAVAQEPSDGVFAGPAGWVWKTATGPAQWQRMRAQGYGDRTVDPLIACRVDPATPFIVTGRAPTGFWVEVADGPDKGCRGLATTNNIRLYDPAAFEERQPAGAESSYDPNSVVIDRQPIIIDRRPIIVVPSPPERNLRR